MLVIAIGRILNSVWGRLDFNHELLRTKLTSFGRIKRELLDVYTHNNAGVQCCLELIGRMGWISISYPLGAAACTSHQANVPGLRGLYPLARAARPISLDFMNNSGGHYEGGDIRRQYLSQHFSEKILPAR